MSLIKSASPQEFTAIFFLNVVQSEYAEGIDEAGAQTGKIQI